jgi:hypothetical protein
MTVTISGTTGIAVPLGSNGAPSNTNTSDSTTGIYFPASNTVAIATGGTNAITINSTQALGLGSSPSYGTSGQVLTSAGSGSVPTWSTPASGISLSANNTWTGTQSFTGSTSALAAILTNAAEVITVSATAATGTINYDVTTQSVLSYTTNASANWTVNFRGSSGTSLNTLMSTGQSLTAVFLVTQGSTAYYNNAVTVDGTSVTPKWQGGSAPSSGDASSIDVYTYTIIKTGSAAFTILASQTKFA